MQTVQLRAKRATGSPAVVMADDLTRRYGEGAAAASGESATGARAAPAAAHRPNGH